MKIDLTKNEIEFLTNLLDQTIDDLHMDIEENKEYKVKLVRIANKINDPIEDVFTLTTEDFEAVLGRTLTPQEKYIAKQKFAIHDWVDIVCCFLIEYGIRK